MKGIKEGWIVNHWLFQLVQNLHFYFQFNRLIKKNEFSCKKSELSLHKDIIYVISYFPKNPKYIATGCRDGSIILTNLQTKEKLWVNVTNVERRERSPKGEALSPVSVAT